MSSVQLNPSPLSLSRDLSRDSLPKLSIDERVAKGMAVREYVNAQKQFEQACTRFNEACSKMRSVVGPDALFVVRIDHEEFLVATNKDSDFDVKPVTFL
jgi:hypothetical protein